MIFRELGEVPYGPMQMIVGTVHPASVAAARTGAIESSISPGSSWKTYALLGGGVFVLALLIKKMLAGRK